MDGDCLTAAILHDVIENLDLLFQSYLKNEFNVDVANLVDGVSKLDKISLTSKRRTKLKIFRKMLLAMSGFTEVIVLKLADRLHNMQALKYLNKILKRLPWRTLEIYAPIAHRFRGMHQFYRELEDLAFEDCILIK